MLVRESLQELMVLGDRIAELTVAQAAALSQYLEEKHGIAAEAAPNPLPEPDVIVPPVDDTPAICDVVLEGIEDGQKISVIRAIREVMQLGLKDALNFVETAPGRVATGLDRAAAEQLQDRLKEAGARVALVACAFSWRPA